jgi:hemerythrin-like domain-containing protein
MKDDLARPADTAMMRIVHDALRRDLERARAAISGLSFPADAQRIAIAGHLGWMMDFLHRHHESEDEWLYPLVRRRDPAAGPLLDAMDADHQRIGPAITGLTEAASAYAGAPAARDGLGEALNRLADVLYPHLRREEDEMMPVVSAFLTEAEWREWDQKYNIKPLGPLELADTGLWILDGLDEADRATVTGLVPPEAVWAVLADVTRVGEWSHECRSVRWLDGSHGGPGARFRGRNRQSFQVLSLRVWADRVIWALIPAHHDRLAALRADLGRLAAIAEAESTTEPKEKIKIKDEAERAGQLLG